ncbi:beta-1,3-galactosyltransferase 5-like [Saccostrea echinata]|uniref:beta-1,3-galactosyltransferase 5-like n=1 Tax=Saccostrea echinata TaxID=191078 RepID=UPI002A83DC5D|nr:beta-1,3-galactosyltransferase 5-like [Saccostrea echinata]
MIGMLRKHRRNILQGLAVIGVTTLCFMILEKCVKDQQEMYNKERARLWLMARHEIDGTITLNGTVRPNRCDECFKFHYRMLKEYPETCKNPGNIQLVLLISTTPKALKRRMVIRETWLTYAKKNLANVRYAFILGAIHDVNLQEMIDEEDKYYKDFVQGDFPDNYYTLTIKTLLGYHWAAKHCPNDTFVVKTDDDVYINIPAMLDITTKHGTQLQHSIGGFCREDIGPVRDIESKYYVSYAEYPSEKFKGYCSGTGYVTSMNVVKKVAQISKNIPFFHLEDVYIAFCIEELKFSLYHIDGFNTVYEEDKYTTLCSLKSDSVVVLHNFKKRPSFLLEIWNVLCYTES